MEQTNTLSRFDNKGRERYMLIHKRPVGPKTAERLFFLYEELSETQRPQEMYMAGWAVAEAGLMATRLDPETRHNYIASANDCWEYALQLEQERAAQKAWRKSTTPSTIETYRIAGALATIPVLEQIPYGKPSKQAVLKMHQDLLTIARSNADDMNTAKQYFGSDGRTSNHRGLGYEHIAQLSISRLHSARLIPVPSFARSDNGSYYPSQTHDLQVLNLNGGDINFVTPLEVKSKNLQKFYTRYQEVGLVFGTGMIDEGEAAVTKAVELFEAEHDGTASPEDIAALDHLTESVVHSIRHFRRPERYGKHCLGAMRCLLNAA